MVLCEHTRLFIVLTSCLYWSCDRHLGQTIRVCDCFQARNMMVTRKSWTGCVVRGGITGVGAVWVWKVGKEERKHKRPNGSAIRGQQPQNLCHPCSPAHTCAAMCPTYLCVSLFAPFPSPPSSNKCPQRRRAQTTIHSS